MDKQYFGAKLSFLNDQKILLSSQLERSDALLVDLIADCKEIGDPSCDLANVVQIQTTDGAEVLEQLFGLEEEAKEELELELADIPETVEKVTEATLHLYGVIADLAFDEGGEDD